MRRVAFGRNLEIAELQDIYDELSNCLQSEADVELDGSELDHVDAGSVQLLAAFCQEARRKSIKVTWKGTSRNFLQDVALLGMEDSLGLAS